MPLRVAVVPRSFATDENAWAEDEGLIQLSQNPALQQYANAALEPHGVSSYPPIGYVRSLVAYEFPKYIRDGKGHVTADDMRDLAVSMAERVQEAWGEGFRDYQVEILPQEEMLKRIQANDMFRYLRDELGWDAYLQALRTTSPRALRSIVRVDNALMQRANARILSDAGHATPLLTDRLGMFWVRFLPVMRGEEEPHDRNAYKAVIALEKYYPLANNRPII